MLGMALATGKRRSDVRLPYSLLLGSTITLLCTCAQLAMTSTSSAASPPTCASVDAENSTAGYSAAPFAVFGYLPEYRQQRFNYEAFFKSGLTHLIFFSAEVDLTSLELIHVDDRLPPMPKWKRIRELANNYGVKLLLCIGGGGRSAGFSRLVSDVLGRRRFISQVQRTVRKRELDGVDFNWEYPGSMTEWLNFGQFLLELRIALDASTPSSTGEGAAVSSLSHPLITMALHPQPTIVHVLRSSRILPTLDYLHWMAYDHIVRDDGHSSVAYAATVLQDSFIGDLDDAVYNARVAKYRASERGEAKRTGRNSIVERKPHEVDHSRKLCLGIPFYGRHREDMRVPPESYEHLWQFIKQWARKRHSTWVEGGPELRALSDYAGYDYNGYDDVKRKMRLARMSKIGGIMIWELGQDVPPGTSPMSLMTAVHEQLTDWERRTRLNGGGSTHTELTMVSGHRGDNTTQSRCLSAALCHPDTELTKNLTKDKTDEDL